MKEKTNKKDVNNEFLKIKARSYRQTLKYLFVFLRGLCTEN